MSSLKRSLVYVILPVLTIFYVIFFTTGCPETWLKELGGDTYGNIYGVITDTSDVGINDVNVGLTPSEDAEGFADNEDKLRAKCTYLVPTGPATGDYANLGNGFYFFERVDINMNTKYIIVWKDGYYPELVLSNIKKFATTKQLTIKLTKQ